MHLDCQGRGSPTVLFEAGALESSAVWSRVRAATAAALGDDVRLCAYDRAGLGYSEATEAPVDGRAAADRLHTLLTSAGVTGPLVMVGHSFGGPLITVYVSRYPQEVAGVVLVDPSHPEQLEALGPDAQAAQEKTARGMSFAAVLARFGLFRRASPLDALFAGLPPEAGDVVRLWTSTPTFFATAGREAAAWDPTMASARGGSFGDRPLRILSAALPSCGR